MAGPWEKYQGQQAPGPWQKYAAPAAPEQPGPDNSDALSKIRTASGGILEGIPVIGPMIRGGVERAAAATIAPFSDETYGQVLERIQQGTQAEKKANPILDTTSQIAGAVGGTIPMVMAAPAAFGAGSAPWYLRSVASGFTGSGLGAADAAVRSGGDLEAIKSGAAWGGGLGLAAPGIGAAVGTGTRMLANRFGPQAGSLAQRLFTRAATDDNVASNLGPRLSELGPDALPMDLGPNLQRQAGALASQPGEAQEIVRRSVAARDMGANARIQGAVDDTLGPPTALQKIEDQITRNMDTLGPQYEEVFRKARAVNTSRIAENLESKIVNLRGDAQKAAQKVRDMLNITGTSELDPSPYTLFQTRQAIDGMLATEANPKVIGVLTDARRAIDTQLTISVPGIKKIDARFAELARQRESLQRGQQTLDSGRTSPRPSELAREVQEGALPQGDMFGPSAVPLRLREGARAEIDRIIGTNANDRVALQRLIKGEGDWNRARLSTLFGKEKADKIIAVLDRERLFADTSQIVTRNSETRARLAASGEVAPTRQPGLLRSAMNVRFGDAAADIGNKALGSARTAAQQATNAELARLLTSNDPANAARIIQLVQAAQRRGDISAQRAKEIVQGLATASQQRLQKTPIPMLSR